MFTAQIVKLNEIDSLRQAAIILESNSILDDTVDHDDWPAHEPLTKRWLGVDQFDLGISELMAGTRETVRFIIAHGHNERAKRENGWYDGDVFIEDKSERINTAKFNSIFFEMGDFVYVAVLMPLSANLNTYINDLLPEELWGSKTREPIDYKLHQDFYYWLLNAFTRNNRVASSNPVIYIRSWTGFHGTTQDTIHRMSGEGERISAILSTLAFLFSDDPFKSLSLAIQYENERIPVHLGETGYLTISNYEYEGMFSNAYHGTSREILLTILMYTKVLPDLFRSYELSKEEGRWNETTKEEFRNSIGDQIISRVRSELEISV